MHPLWNQEAQNTETAPEVTSRKFCNPVHHRRASATPGRCLDRGVFCACRPACFTYSTSSLLLVTVFCAVGRRSRCPPWGTSGATTNAVSTPDASWRHHHVQPWLTAKVSLETSPPKVQPERNAWWWWWWGGEEEGGREGGREGRKGG